MIRLTLIFYTLFCMGISSASYAAMGFIVPEDRVYTLYRNSIVVPLARYHVATFDVDDSDESYNQINCDIAMELFQNQSGVEVRYWCEKGYVNE
jgi:hypothetical protein